MVDFSLHKLRGMYKMNTTKSSSSTQQQNQTPNKINDCETIAIKCDIVERIISTRTISVPKNLSKEQIFDAVIDHSEELSYEYDGVLTTLETFKYETSG